MKINAIICGLSVCIAPISASAQMSLEFPTGADLQMEKASNVDSYLLPISGYTNGTVTTQSAEGRVAQQVWRTVNSQAETLSLLSPLRQQLVAQGFEILFECETRSCGGFDFRFNIDVIEEPEMHVDLGDYRFLSASKTTDEANEYVGLLVSRSADHGYIQMTRVGESEASQDNIVVSTKQSATDVSLPVEEMSFAGLLTKNGSAVLEGVKFANGASSLDDASSDTLQDLALFLSANPLASIVLVGHTDASGSLPGNVALSRKRANSVMQELVKSFDISPVRLTAEGIGYLAPRASNETEDGRRLNRRVEVVLTPEN